MIKIDQDNIGNVCDAVHHPNHYKVFPDQEAIQIIERALTPQEFVGFLKGNYLKYRLRMGEKDDALQDLAKSDKYRQWLWELV